VPGNTSYFVRNGSCTAVSQPHPFPPHQLQSADFVDVERASQHAGCSYHWVGQRLGSGCTAKFDYYLRPGRSAQLASDTSDHRPPWACGAHRNKAIPA
jgi:hypothetical protein